LSALEKDRGLAKRLKAVRKALGYLELNPRHKALNTHSYESILGAGGVKRSLKPMQKTTLRPPIGSFGNMVLARMKSR
jgi:hypothetical protein